MANKGGEISRTLPLPMLGEPAGPVAPAANPDLPVGAPQDRVLSQVPSPLPLTSIEDRRRAEIDERDEETRRLYGRGAPVVPLGPNISTISTYAEDLARSHDPIVQRDRDKRPSRRSRRNIQKRHV